MSTEKFIPFDDVLGGTEPCRPLIPNYSTAQRYACGVIVQWHDTNKQLKQHVTMTGKTLDIIRQTGITDSELVKNLLSMEKSNIKRIDLAITSQRTDGSMHEFLPHFAHFATLAGWCETRLELDKPVTDTSLNVQTAYIGNRKKREYMRVYDKGIELGEAANKIVRIELERHSVANSIARDVAKGIDYGMIINRYVSFPNVPVWNEIVSAKKQPRTRVEIDIERDEHRENEKLWQWIFNSVAPAYARALYNDNYEPSNNPNVDEFARLITHHYNQLIDKV